MTKHRLIGAEVSYYTGKVRAYLHYKNIDFEEVSATREVYKEIILPRTGVAYIPVLISDDDVAVQDSTAIIDFLERRYPEPAIYPDTPLQRLVALLLEVYADEWLVIPAMHYRWNYAENRDFAIREFGRLSAPAVSVAEQQRIGEQLSKPFAGALPALGVTSHSAAAIERSYLGLLAEFEAHLAEHPYLLGSRPSIGDFALFGPLYAHLHRDPHSGRLLQAQAPRVADWVERLNGPQSQAGALLADDAVPASLQPILRRMFREQAPVLISTLHRLDAWHRQNPGVELPRAIGKHKYRLGQIVEQRAVFPFNIWRWQRPYDFYHALRGAQRESADALLRTLGGYQVINVPLQPRLRREGNRLRIAE